MERFLFGECNKVFLIEQGFPNQGLGPQFGSECFSYGVIKMSWGQWDTPRPGGVKCPSRNYKTIMS